MYRVVHPTRIEDYWLQVAPWIAVAIGEDEEAWVDLSFIKAGLLHGQFRLWIAEKPGRNEIDAVMVVEFFNRGCKTICAIRWLSGKNIEDKLIDIGIVENWALGMGAHRLEIWGRPGWEKLFRSLGYRKDFVVISRDLTRSIN